MKDLIDALKSKEREKIADQVSVEIQSGREWLQEHGEWALLVGILAGVVFVLFFKVLVLLVVLGGLASYVIWQLSLEDSSASVFENLDPAAVNEGQRQEVSAPVVELPDGDAAEQSSNGHHTTSSASKETPSE